MAAPDSGKERRLVAKARAAAKASRADHRSIDKFDSLTGRLWQSVRQKLIHVATAAGFMLLDVGMPCSSAVLATDAMGHNEIDHGVSAFL